VLFFEEVFSSLFLIFSEELVDPVHGISNRFAFFFGVFQPP